MCFARLMHRFQKFERSLDVVEISIRFGHRFTHRRIRGKVNYGLNAELLDRSANQRPVRDLAFDQRPQRTAQR
jgi:hypothetical protein